MEFKQYKVNVQSPKLGAVFSQSVEVETCNVRSIRLIFTPRLKDWTKSVWPDAALAGSHEDDATRFASPGRMKDP